MVGLDGYHGIADSGPIWLSNRLYCSRGCHSGAGPHSAREGSECGCILRSAPCGLFAPAADQLSICNAVALLAANGGHIRPYRFWLLPSGPRSFPDAVEQQRKLQHGASSTNFLFRTQSWPRDKQACGGELCWWLVHYRRTSRSSGGAGSSALTRNCMSSRSPEVT